VWLFIKIVPGDSSSPFDSWLREKQKALTIASGLGENYFSAARLFDYSKMVSSSDALRAKLTVLMMRTNMCDIYRAAISDCQAAFRRNGRGARS
jgi:hypothetical protein